jgi:flagellar biosynthesis protein FliP
MKKKVILVVILVLLIAILGGCSAVSGTSGAVSSILNGSGGSGALDSITGGRSQTVDILLLITIIAILPSILLMMTCFPRIIIVLSLIRNGLGLQQMPPNQVLIGLSLFLTLFVMGPVINKINTEAYQPYVQNKITQEEAIDKAMEPVREFMLKQTMKENLDFFIKASENAGEIKVTNDVPNTVLIPAFMTSEITRGFEIGFLLYIPFIVIDMIVASVLMSMGMMMLPPIVISLPFKLLLFVLVNGWMLTVQTLINSFG